MGNEARAVKEHLARAKGYFHRHDVMRALASTAAAVQTLLKAPTVVGADRMAVDNAFHEITGMLNRTEEVTANLPQGLVYRKGAEKAFLLSLAKLVQLLKEAEEKESYEETLARKLKIDRNLSYGRRLLEAGKINDARDAFDEAAGLYVDEESLFRLMGQACIDNSQGRLALRYLKQAEKVDPEKRSVISLLIDACKLEGNIPLVKQLEARLKGM